MPLKKFNFAVSDFIPNIIKEVVDIKNLLTVH